MPQIPGNSADYTVGVRIATASQETVSQRLNKKTHSKQLSQLRQKGGGRLPKRLAKALPQPTGCQHTQVQKAKNPDTETHTIPTPQLALYAGHKAHSLCNGQSVSSTSLLCCSVGKYKSKQAMYSPIQCLPYLT